MRTGTRLLATEDLFDRTVCDVLEAICTAGLADDPMLGDPLLQQVLARTGKGLRGQ